MKAIANRFFIIIAFLFGIVNCIAKNSPPPPSPNGKTEGPPPPGLPIDEGIYLVFILAFLYGIYIIYNYQLKKRGRLKL